MRDYSDNGFVSTSIVHSDLILKYPKINHNCVRSTMHVRSKSSLPYSAHESRDKMVSDIKKDFLPGHVKCSLHSSFRPTLARNEPAQVHVHVGALCKDSALCSVQNAEWWPCLEPGQEAAAHFLWRDVVDLGATINTGRLPSRCRLRWNPSYTRGLHVWWSFCWPPRRIVVIVWTM